MCAKFHLPWLRGRHTRRPESFGNGQAEADLQPGSGPATANDQTASRTTTSTSAPFLVSTDANSQGQTLHEQDGQKHSETNAPSNAKIPAAPRDLWLEASNKLNKRTQQQLQMDDLASNSAEKLVCNLIKSIQKKQRACEDNFSKISVAGHEIILRDYAENIIGYLTQINNIVIPVVPLQVSLPLSVINVLMQIPVMEAAQMRALLVSSDKIIRIVARGKVYESIYNPETLPELVFENFQDALVDLYGGVLEVIANSTSLFSKSAAAKTFNAFLHPNETADLLSRLDMLQKQLDQDAHACQTAWSSVAHKQLNDRLESLDAPLRRVDENVHTLLQQFDDTDRLKILDWISKISPWSIHKGLPPRTRGTCEWLLMDDRFHKWEYSSSSDFLWLQGSPGTGKTGLTSRVVDHVQSSLDKTPNEEGFAFFYCNQTDPARRQPLSVLQSFVRQLSTTTNSPEYMQRKLREIYGKMSERGSHLTFDECKQLILEFVNIYPRTTLVLDALDECQESRVGILGRTELLVEAFEFWLKRSERPVKIFVSSRPDGDIRSLFASRPSIRIEATDNFSDIDKFLDEELRKTSRTKTFWSESLIRDIKGKLLDNSGGMFQWVALQLNQISSCESVKAIREELEDLPPDLDATYKEIYNKIAKRRKSEKALADRAFMWVMCACKPLSSEELLAAICVDPDLDPLDLTEPITESSLLNLCNNLLVLDSERKIWRFSHLSVAEYFSNHHRDLTLSHCNAAKVCLKLLIETYKIDRKIEVEHSDNKHSDDEPDPEEREIFNLANPFQIYIRHHWAIHVRTYEERIAERQEADPKLTSLLESFLGSPGESSVQYRRWFEQMSSDNYDIAPQSSFFNSLTKDRISPSTISALAMCRFSFYYVLLQWWTTPEMIDISLKNSQNENLLILAIIAGSKSICRALIVERGAQPNLELSTGWYGSALATAASRRNLQIVEFLIQQGANPNLILSTGQYGSALTAAAAATRGNLEIVEFLIQQGANPNLILSTGQYGSALTAAAARGNLDIVKFLVKQGAQPDLVLSTGDYGSALAAAAYWGWKECVEILLEAGANANSILKTGLYRSALHASHTEVSPKNLKWAWWDSSRKEQILQQEKAEVAELLRRHGATD